MSTSSIGQRCVDLLLKTHDPKCVQSGHLLASATYLLLQQCAASVDYRRPLYDTPLRECVFQVVVVVVVILLLLLVVL